MIPYVVTLDCWGMHALLDFWGMHAILDFWDMHAVLNFLMKHARSDEEELLGTVMNQNYYLFNPFLMQARGFYELVLVFSFLVH